MQIRIDGRQPFSGDALRKVTSNLGTGGHAGGFTNSTTFSAVGAVSVIAMYMAVC